jgi:hypothetical protein
VKLTAFMTKRQNPSIQKAVKKFNEKKGFYTHQRQSALESTQAFLYKMRDEGIIEPLSRGAYRLANLPSLNNQDLAAIATAIPQGVICLI